MKKTTIKNKILCFDEETHTYSVDGNKIPSVTTLITHFYPIPPELPMDILRRAGNIGSAVHTATEYYDDGDLDWKSLDKQIIGFLAAYKKYIQQAKPKIIQSEQRVAQLEGFRYAGTLDRIIEINNKSILLDIKSGKEFLYKHFLQMAAYDNCVNMPIDDYCILYLRKTGKYFLRFLSVENFSKESLLEDWKAMLRIYYRQRGD